MINSLKSVVWVPVRKAVETGELHLSMGECGQTPDLAAHRASRRNRAAGVAWATRNPVVRYSKVVAIEAVGCEVEL